MQGNVGRGVAIRQKLDAVALCQLRHRVTNAYDLDLKTKHIVVRRCSQRSQEFHSIVFKAESHVKSEFGFAVVHVLIVLIPTARRLHINIHMLFS
jgi:hypothetical protein